MANKAIVANTGCATKAPMENIRANREKQEFTFFTFLPPLYRRFRLSRASQNIDIEKIDRFVAKFLNFMAYGSVLNRFCVQCMNFVASASKIYRHSIEILSTFYRNSIEIL